MDTVLTLDVCDHFGELLRHDLAQRGTRQRLERNDRIDTTQEFRWELSTIFTLNRGLDDLLVISHRLFAPVVIGVVFTNGAVDLAASVRGQHDVCVEERHLTTIFIRQTTVIEHLKQQAYDEW